MKGSLIRFAVLFAVITPTPAALTAQGADGANAAEVISSSFLPDSPGALQQASMAREAVPPAMGKYKRIVPPDRSAKPLSAGDKIVLSLAGQVSLSAVGSSLITAGISHWDDSAPHYGVDKGAFGERLGAAYLKQTSESVFSYGVYASLFHDDPRYYVMGNREPFKKRVVYSATRVVITRKDDGSASVNWPKLAGILSAAALSNAYYPDRDRTAGRNASSAATSIATSAGVNELHEFLGDVLHRVMHKHQETSHR